MNSPSIKIKIIKTESILAFAILTFCTTHAFAQVLYFGYPECTVEGTKKNLNTGDIVIVALPNYLHHMRFYKSENVSKLSQFLNQHPQNRFQIQIHLFLDENKYNQDISDRLAKSLEQILKEDCKINNYTIVAMGSTIPLQCDQESSIYRKLNSRIEIRVEICTTEMGKTNQMENS